MDPKNSISVQQKSKRSDQIYGVLTPILIESDKDPKLFQSSEKDEKAFEDYFLSKHTEFEPWLKGVEPTFRRDFFKNARKFLLTAFQEIKKRLPSPDSVIFLAECFIMDNKDCIEKVRTLGNKFKNPISEAELGLFNKELNKLQYRYEDINEKITKHSFFEAWEYEKGKFPLIYKLVRAIQTLPYSSVFIERSFSSLLDIKTLKKNKISASNLEACLLFKQEFRGENIQLTSEMLEKYNESFKKPSQISITEEHQGLETQTQKNISRMEEEKDELSSTNLKASNLNEERVILEKAANLFYSKFLNFQPREGLNLLTTSERPLKRLSNTKLHNDTLKKSKSITNSSNPLLMPKSEDEMEVESSSENEKLEKSQFDITY